MKYVTHVLVLLLVLATTGPAAACVTDAECSDGSVCTGTETCQAGVCIPGTPLECADTNPCTTDSCHPTLGCTFTPTPNECHVGGKLLSLRTHGTPRLTLQTDSSIAGTSFPQNGSTEDPVLHGASLRLVTEAGDQFDTVYVLPSSHWRYVGTAGPNNGYHYQDKGHVNGPIGLALVRNGKPTKIKGGGALNVTLASNPNPVKAVLRFGPTRRYCLAFGSRRPMHTRRSGRRRRHRVPARRAAPSSTTTPRRHRVSRPGAGAIGRGRDTVRLTNGRRVVDIRRPRGDRRRHARRPGGPLRRDVRQR
jgi:hypothetical protein